MKKRSNAGLLLGLVIILIFFTGIGLVKLYTSVSDPVSVNHTRDNEDENQDNEQVQKPDRNQESPTEEPTENQTPKEDTTQPNEEDMSMYRAQIEELKKKIAKTDSILTSALEESRLSVKVIGVKDMQFALHAPLTMNWQRKTQQVEIPEDMTMTEVRNALINAAKNGGSELLDSTDDKSGETLYIGFSVNGASYVTHKIVLRFKEQRVISSGSGKAQLAFIIDDLGYDWPTFDKMMTVPRPMTFAVLPHLPRSVEQAKTVWEKGYQLIMHLPMEPASKDNPGKGAVLTSMRDDQIIATIAEDLAALPQGLIGANNHMGSKATADPRVMEVVLKYLKERGMFFVDSKTAAKSAVATVAQEVGIPYAVNRIFIDNVENLEVVKGQIRKAAQIALRDGKAICIGHVRKYTAEAILQMLDELESMGVKIVYAKELLEQK